MQTPQKGFYYHYKHTPDSIDNCAYEFVGVGHYTEEESTYFVIYRPLYKTARVWKEGGLFEVRPLAMFMENVTKDGKTFPRFSKITDPVIITHLEANKAEMYGSHPL